MLWIFCCASPFQASANSTQDRQICAKFVLNSARKDCAQCASYLTARRSSAFPLSLRGINGAESASVILSSSPLGLRPAADQLISFQRASYLRAPLYSLRRAGTLS